jgi:hypothetical protein
MNREELEREALRVCSSDIWYDLADTIHETPDDDLQFIINCNGDFELESKMYDMQPDYKTIFKGKTIEQIKRECEQLGIVKPDYIK